MNVGSAIMKQIQCRKRGDIGLWLTLEICPWVVRWHWKAINWHITNKKFLFRLIKQFWQPKSSSDNCLPFRWCLGLQGRVPANFLGTNNIVATIGLNQAWGYKAIIQTLASLRWGDCELKAWAEEWGPVSDNRKSLVCRNLSATGELDGSRTNYGKCAWKLLH